jgi:tRNA dimethylallyltransferase
MSNEQSLLDQKIIFVVGSTASGKSQWALNLAEKYNGSIINIDSIQFYKGLVIGSAAPTEAEKRQVPHYLYNYVDAPSEMTAGEFLRDFYKLLKTTELKYPLFVVGGTGFYVQALEKGMYNIPEVPIQVKQDVEVLINEQGAELAYKELIEFDPQSLIHKNDAYRIGRALEVKRAFGQTMTELSAEFENNKKLNLKNPFIKIGKFLDKETLLNHVSLRTERMLNDGIIDEVQVCLQLGFKNWAPLQSVGYFEVLNYLQKNTHRQNLSADIKQSTMKLIKKQKTWFKRDHTILWSVGDRQNEKQIEQKIDLFLNESKI